MLLPNKVRTGVEFVDIIKLDTLLIATKLWCFTWEVKI